ncbi:MAG: PD-(D/E)XK nuclease family protein, partial [Gammaproteobacteria bacterium]|nr:PD-(D/E)XK nuclease family protein [Gammaproteobacteria bacterium]
MNQILDSNTLILTPNQRLATYLQHQYTKQMPKAILTLDQWLEKLWIICHDQRILLTQIQESLIWRQLIEADGITVSSNILEKALEAWKLTKKWKLNPELWQKQNYSNEIKSFVVWYNKFHTLCFEHNFISMYQLPDAIIANLANNNIKLPQTIILFGFKELTPQINSLVHHLKQNNVRIKTLDQTTYFNSNKKRISFNSQEQELIAMAQWAKQKLSLNPDATIGCVVPNLNKLHKQIKRYLKATFHNETVFNICSNETFADIPLINSALALLGIQEPSQIEKLSQLLLPFVPKAKKTITLQKLSDLKLMPSEWLPVFNNHLEQFGWPKDQPVQDFLPQFTALDLVTNKISFATALTYLQQQANNTIATPPNTWQTINVLDSLEASSINFTYLWVSGMDNKNWPRATTPNPFLPFSIQQNLKMPHTTAKYELEYCETLTEGFKHCANEVVFSSVNQVNGHDIKPSALIIELQETTANELKLTLSDSVYQLNDNYQLETINDNFGPKIAPNTTIKGGSKVFELQSLCPFRAFAELRLHAKELPEPEFGISEKTRGIILHQALQSIWQLLKTQHQLLELAEPELRNLINECVTKAINHLGDSSPFYAFEKKTLASLLWQFLLQEKSRAPFIVLATEKKLDFTLEGITVNLRIDRIDELSDKSTLIIDYKTGKTLPAINDWFSEHPKNLQLPLYSIATDGKHNIALMQINPDAIKFISIALEKINNDLIYTWRSYLEKLATDFKLGKADVAPIDSKACELCKLQPLCRIAAKNHPAFLPEEKQQKTTTISLEQEKKNQLLSTPLDNREREEALNITKSFIVQAPAGSGKTTLLTKRFIKLLAQAKHPENILAITFTRLAANEMRDRILEALELRAEDESIQELALQVLKQDHKQQWNLLKNPERLRIQTIDALCLSLTERLPILAKLESSANIASNAEAENCYRLATRELLEHLQDSDYAPYLEVILLYLHNNWGKLEKLCIEMLKRRLQWLPHVAGNKQDRKTLEIALEQITQENIEKVLQFFPQELKPELLDLLAYAKENLSATSPNLHAPIDAWGFQDWEFVATLLLTSTFAWRINIG